MELYAAGHNAWHQLDFFDSTNTPDPEDIYKFTSRLSGRRIGRPVSRTSYTLVDVDGELRRAGFANKSSQHPPSHNGPYDISQDYRSAVNAHGQALELQGSSEDAVLRLSTLEEDQEQLDLGPAKQVVAFQAGFAFLTTDGRVQTWGDERFPHCLAWDQNSDDFRAGEWNVVHWLEDIPQGPIVKIGAGGYILGALTKGGDLYTWGQPTSHQPFLQNASEEPTPINLDKDIKDFAIGYQHIILLTTDSEIFVGGCNKNGQLGLGMDVEWADSWTKINIPLEEGSEIVGVDAGDKTSFILTKNSKGTEFMA